MTDQDKDIMEFLNEQAKSEDEGAKICRYAGKLLAMSQARSAKLRAAAERIRVLGEEVEAGRRLDAMRSYYLAIKDPKVAECGPYEIMPLMDAQKAARAATDAARRGA